jgi:hypothetical protein
MAFHFLGRTRELDAARFATAACVNLGLDDPELAAERLGRPSRLGRRRRYVAPRNRNSVLSEQCLGLIFMEVQRRFLRERV